MSFRFAPGTTQGTTPTCLILTVPSRADPAALEPKGGEENTDPVLVWNMPGYWFTRLLTAVRISARCEITSREYCTFMNGYFHEEATLCSQVSIPLLSAHKWNFLFSLGDMKREKMFNAKSFCAASVAVFNRVNSFFVLPENRVTAFLFGRSQLHVICDLRLSLQSYESCFFMSMWFVVVYFSTTEGH